MRTMKREEAIRDIRQKLLEVSDDEHSICEVAARNGIFCGGFSQFSDDELNRRYKWIVERRHPSSRRALEVLANDWQLARERAEDVELACDVQLHDRDTCDGWDTFSNAHLARFHRELCGEEIDVVDGEAIHYRTFK